MYSPESRLFSFPLKNYFLRSSLKSKDDLPACSGKRFALHFRANLTYDLREGESIAFATVEPSVAVNHAGTIITKEPIIFGEEGYIELDDDSSPNFLGDHMFTLRQRRTSHPEGTEAESGADTCRGGDRS